MFMKRLIALILLSTFVVTGCVKSEQPLQKMNYEYTLTEEDVDNALTIIGQIEQNINDRNNDNIVEAEKSLREIDAYIAHQYLVAEINYYSDLEDADAYDAYVVAENAYMTFKEEKMRVLKLLYESDLTAKTIVFMDWTKDEIKTLLASSKEVAEIEKKQNKLMNEFIELDVENPDDWSIAVEEIYSQYVNCVDDLATYYGYDNYYDYAANELYVREYSKEQRELFRKNIKEEILPFYLDIYETYQEKKGDLSKEQKEVFSSLRKDTCNQSDEYLKGYIKSYPDKMGEKMNYLFERNGIIYTESENAYDIAYTNYSVYYDQPFVFLGNGCQDMLTLVHEMGHYIAFYHNKDSLKYDIAEVQSQGNEWLMLKYLEDKLDEEVYEVFMLWRLSYGLENIILSTFIDEYEEFVYTYEKEIDGEVLESIFLDLVNGYVGMEYFFDNDSLYDYVQQVTMRAPVYYLSYATSEIAAMTFYTVATEEGYDVAQEMYVDICLDAPTDMMFADTLMETGLPNPFEDDTIERIIDAFEK